MGSITPVIRQHANVSAIGAAFGALLALASVALAAAATDPVGYTPTIDGRYYSTSSTI